MPATATAIRKIITTKTEAMTAADDTSASGVASGTLDDVGGTREETGMSTWSFR